MHHPSEVSRNLGGNLPGHPKSTNQNLPLTCLIKANAYAPHGCSAQRRELPAVVDQVAKGGVDCVNGTAIHCHKEACRFGPMPQRSVSICTM